LLRVKNYLFTGLDMFLLFYRLSELKKDEHLPVESENQPSLCPTLNEDSTCK